ncbi:Biotin-protein ligase / Biotin operon repressor [Raoultella ornithinolytica]|nr:Biotin-protein ligase / Biotin operon repressor [Raoultella ornithinolytica]
MNCNPAMPVLLNISRPPRSSRAQVVSPFGANLYLSMYWRLEQGPAAAVGLSLVIGIVIAEVLQSLGADKVRVKWPNDLYLQDRKLSGFWLS